MNKRFADILKKVAGAAFVIAFSMALVLYGNIGRQYISMHQAKIIFITAGGIGLFLNLLTFQTGKHSQLFSFLYWSGSVILFIGLIFLQFRLPKGFYIIVAGITILGLSFVLPSSLLEKKTKSDDILDNID